MFINHKETLDGDSYYHTALCKPSALIITESDVRNNGQSFVFNYTLAKAIVEYASAVSYFPFILGELVFLCIISTHLFPYISYESENPFFDLFSLI